MAAIALWSAVNLGIPVAEAKPRATAPAISAPQPAAPENIRDGAPRPRTLVLGLKQMGAQGPLTLRGVEGSIGLPFSVRSDEVVVGARLKIHYSYSPSLLPELSHLVVTVNEEVAAVVPLPRDQHMNNTRELVLDPRLFTDYNKLTFRLIGHYTYRCEDPTHSSLWLNLSNAGQLELSLAPLALANDLAFLPNPFFDRRDHAALRLPFVFTGRPSAGTLKAAGIVASWFGGLASYRGATFPVSTGGLPEGNAVVFRVGGEAPEGSGPPPEGPTLSVEPHPTLPTAKLLVVAGRNEDELQRAARALVLGDPVLNGRRVLITEDKEPAPRKPYDAPAWLPTDRPVRFGELMRLEDMQVRGFYPDVIRLNFRVAPDLFTWRSQGVPMDLKYRFTRLPFNKNSSLNVSINNNFVHALALNDPERKPEKRDHLKLPVLDDNLALREDVLFVPPYQVGGRNQMQFHYYFDVVKEGECRDSLPDNLRGMIDPESTLDFSPFPHYVALPNLAYFANIGYPYTRMADLSETAVVLPEAPDAGEMALYLNLMGRMGEATGYPVLRHAVVRPSEVDTMADRDLLVIGSGSSQPLMAKWAERLPMVERDGVRHLREPDLFRRALYRWAEKDVQPLSRPDGTVSLKGVGHLAAMMAFESPLRAGRSVVFFYGDRSAELARIADTLNDPERVAQVQGDFVVVENKAVGHYRVADTYYVGHLPTVTWLRWALSQYPLLSALLGVLVAVLLAVLTYRALRRVAARRLDKKA